MWRWNMDTCYEDQRQHGIYLYVYFIFLYVYFFITSPNLHNKGSWFAFISLCLTFSISLSLNLWSSSSQMCFSGGLQEKIPTKMFGKNIFFLPMIDFQQLSFEKSTQWKAICGIFLSWCDSLSQFIQILWYLLGFHRPYIGSHIFCAGGR